MLICLGCDIHFQVAASVPMIAHMKVHPSRTLDLVEPDQFRIEPAVEIEQYQDSFGNLASRLLLPPGRIRLHNSFLIEDSGGPDSQDPRAEEVPIDRLLAETLRYLLASRYSGTKRRSTPSCSARFTTQVSIPIVRNGAAFTNPC